MCPVNPGCRSGAPGPFSCSHRTPEVLCQLPCPGSRCRGIRPPGPRRMVRRLPAVHPCQDFPGPPVVHPCQGFPGPSVVHPRRISLDPGPPDIHPRRISPVPGPPDIHLYRISPVPGLLALLYRHGLNPLVLNLCFRLNRCRFRPRLQLLSRPPVPLTPALPQKDVNIRPSYLPGSGPAGSASAVFSVCMIKRYCCVSILSALLTSSGRFGTHKLVKICFHHSIINFTVLVRFPPDVFLSILIGSDKIHGPCVKGSIALPDFTVQRRKVGFILNPLTVRRIR